MLKREMKRLGVNGLQIESAGVSPDDQPLNPSWPMRWASLRRGFWLKPKPRLIRKRDFSRFDLVIAMDRDVLFSIETIAKSDTQNVKLLSAFLPENWPVDVPDPMRRSVSVCNRVLDMLETACGGICRHLQLDQATGNSVIERN